MESNKRSTLHRLPAILSPLAFVVVVIVIGFLFPRESKFKYQYEKQQTWRYNDLVAPFDFAIRKTDQEIEAERQQILAATPPVFELDETIATQRKAAFVQSFEQQLQAAQTSNQFTDFPRHPDRYWDYGLALLDRIYQRGILRLNDELRAMPKDQVFTIIRGNTFQEQTLENIPTYAAILEMLRDSLPYSPLKEPELLLPLLQEQIQANLFYSPERTAQLRNAALAALVTSRGLVQKGALIITKNSFITDEQYQILHSFEQEYQQQVLSKRAVPSVFLGYLILTILVIFLLAMYIRQYAPFVYNRLPKLVFILMWPILFSYLVFLVEGIGELNSYLVPFCIVPIVIKTFYNERLALFTHLIVVLLAGFLSSLGYEFVFLQILAGMVVVLSNIDTRDWSGFFYAILFIFLTYAIGYLGLVLIRENRFWDIDWSIYSWLFLNSFLTLLAYPLIPLLERVFGFVSPITLVELSDMNRPLFRELALKAPGTLQHSLQVGNMSEAAARRIGADPLLVKVGALYHDIGKTQNPTFFIENQGPKNPHEGISDLESAKIIIDHVPEGVKLAKKHGLPQVLIDFILTHHGTTRTEYLYRNYKTAHPEEVIDKKLFRYPGPRPRSKEEAILMLADSIEAACKSLKNPSEEELFHLIDKIVEGKLSGGQLKDAVISFRELEECRLVFRQIMRSVHHLRVAYPENKEEQED